VRRLPALNTVMSAPEADSWRQIALPPPICSAFHKRSSGSASLLPHERVIRSRLRSPSLSNGNSPLRRNRRSGSRHIPQSPFPRHNPAETRQPIGSCCLPHRAHCGGSLQLHARPRSYPLRLGTRNVCRQLSRARQALAAEVPETFEAHTRVCLLLKRHGQEICKRTKRSVESTYPFELCFFTGYRSLRSTVDL